MPSALLTRDAFRDRVFARDRHRCVVCGAPAKDAHHLIERRLFPDGGYYLDNGVSLCSPHHRDAEATTRSCEALRAAAGIAHVILPPHLHRDRRYDKWGNPVRPDDTRLRGELYFEEPVQKALAPLLHRFLPRSEEPRIPALPWAAHAATADLVADPAAFTAIDRITHADPAGQALVLDATGLYEETGDPARSPPPAIQDLPSQLADLLPIEGRLVVTRTADTLLVTAAWDGRHTCLSWEDTAALADLAGLPLAATLPASPGALAALPPHRVRPAGSFHRTALRRCVGHG